MLPRRMGRKRTESEEETMLEVATLSRLALVLEVSNTLRFYMAVYTDSAIIDKGHRGC